MAKKKKTEEAGPGAADIAFAAGNYAAVRALAKEGDARAAELMPMTTIDMKQVGAGIVAFVVVLIAAAITLRG